MQYIVTALDYQDKHALERRLACRAEHLEKVTHMIQAGSFISGGAMLDADGNMIGSSMHVEFSSRDDLEHWLANDVYTLNKVWEKIDIQECRLVPVNELKNSL